MHLVFLGLGTNMGQREHHLEQAVAGLSPVMRVTAVSPIYETAPWGLEDQPAFLNLCLAGKTSLSPQKLLSTIQNLEEKLGRTPTVKWGPRLIDIDILLYEDFILQTDHLTIPHPLMTERAFVLVPLADIAPQVIHPVRNQTIRELATAVDATSVTRLPQQRFGPESIYV